MIAPRWSKVFKDLSSNKVRTLLVALSIGVGVFAVGFAATSYLIVSQDLDADFQTANPYTATIYAAPFDDDAAAAVRKVKGVSEAEGRSLIGGKVVAANNELRNITITAIPQPERMRINVLKPTAGGEALPPLRFKDIYIEASARRVLPARPGDQVTVQLSDGSTRVMNVTALVHDPTTLSATFTNQISAYVSRETMAWLGGGAEWNTMLIRLGERQRDEAYVREVASQAADKIRDGGRMVYVTVVYQPGRHPAESVVQSLMMLMGGLGLLSTLLSGFLVVNTITALLTQHVRQIGMMKAIGAGTRQIVTMYIVLVLFYGIVALVIALPLSSLISYGMEVSMSTMLNFIPGRFRVPLPSLILQAFVALGLPILAALFPVLSGARTTVREALGNYGLSAGGFGQSWVDRWVEKLRFFSRPMLISLRNTFRRKGRLALTLSTLTLGGAIFIAVFNIQGSFNLTLEKTLGYFLSDINLGLYSMHHVNQVHDLAQSIPGVVRVEPWHSELGQLLAADKATATEIQIIAPPNDSTLIAPVVTKGRWLIPGDQNALVVGNHLRSLRPDVNVGDEVIISINEKEFPFVVVGEYQMAGTVIPPFVYADFDYLTRLVNRPGRSSGYRIQTASAEPEFEARVARQLTEVLDNVGIRSSVITGAEIRAQQGMGFNIVIYFLMAMALLIGVVGGLGLMGTMSMNVIERTREIGVMRSIGATHRAILGMVVFEGMFIGVLSWILAMILAYPISKALNDLVGIAFVNAPMNMVIAPGGFVISLGIVLVISAVASLLPALNAVRMTVRDVLAYE